MVALSNCCGFLSLRTGSLTAAVITGLYSFLGLIMVILTWAKITPEEDILLLEETSAHQSNVTVTYATTLIVFLLFLGWFVTSALLLIGILRCKPKLLTSWVIGTSIVLCVACLDFLSLLYRTFNHNEHSVLSLINTAIQISFLFYLMLVVISYRRDMPTCLAQYHAVAYTIPGNPYHPCELPPKYEA